MFWFKKKEEKKGWLYWMPRILAILYVLFLSVFALDVFGEYETWWETSVALFMHLIPSFVLVGLIFVAWRWKWVGGALLLILGIVFTIFFKTYRDLIVFLLISGPLFLIGVLFLVGRKKG